MSALSQEQLTDLLTIGQATTLPTYVCSLDEARAYFDGNDLPGLNSFIDAAQSQVVDGSTSAAYFLVKVEHRETDVTELIVENADEPSWTPDPSPSFEYHDDYLITDACDEEGQGQFTVRVDDVDLEYLLSNALIYEDTTSEYVMMKPFRHHFHPLHENTTIGKIADLIEQRVNERRREFFKPQEEAAMKKLGREYLYDANGDECISLPKQRIEKLIELKFAVRDLSTGTTRLTAKLEVLSLDEIDQSDWKDE